MRTHGYHDDNYTAHIKRIKHQALKTRRLAYHLVDGTYSSAERHEPGFYRFFPDNSQYGKMPQSSSCSGRDCNLPTPRPSLLYRS